jgi:hypothetical protein
MGAVEIHSREVTAIVFTNSSLAKRSAAALPPFSSFEWLHIH